MFSKPLLCILEVKVQAKLQQRLHLLSEGNLFPSPSHGKQMIFTDKCGLGKEEICEMMGF
jgi:hypothetical protein